MCAATRRNKQRRGRMERLIHPTSHTTPLFVDRLEYVQRRLPEGEKVKEPDATLVSADNIFSAALTRHLLNHLDMPVFFALNDAIMHQTSLPSPHLIIDLDSLNIPILSVLKKIKQGLVSTPQHQIILLSAFKDPAVARFIRLAVDCRIVERRQPTEFLRQLLDINHHADLAELYGSPRFSTKEWAILSALGRGDSLKSVALFLGKPYHHVVYRFNVLLGRLALDSRSKLLRLLHEISVAKNVRY